MNMSETDFSHIDGLRGFGMRASKAMLPGYHALVRRGKVVWLGRIGAPIEDVECDCVILHPKDWDACVAAFRPYREG
jgi:hypothetical protein